MKPKILVVEDEALIAMHIKLIIEELDYEVAINIFSVEDAIAFIENNPPVLVLIDINLNKSKDGVDLGKYLLKKDCIPYIYITSYSDASTLDRVNETRPSGYIVKPFKPSDLISTITIVLNNYKHRAVDPLREKVIKDDNVPYRLREVTNYINENIHKKIEIDELAALTKWKRHYFMKVFSKYLHVSPYQYILNRKIERSKILLKETKIPLNEIAYDLGFSSYANFCNAFKKNCEITPENYRKRFDNLD